MNVDHDGKLFLEILFLLAVLVWGAHDFEKIMSGNVYSKEVEIVWNLQREENVL